MHASSQLTELLLESTSDRRMKSREYLYEVYDCICLCQKADFPKHMAVCPMLARLQIEGDCNMEISAFAKEITERSGECNLAYPLWCLLW